MNEETRRANTGEWSVGARSETGYVRNENQDRMSCVETPCGYAYIVSDGMGGHRAGALAAELTIDILTRALPGIQSLPSAPSEIKHALEEANRTVYERGHSGDAETKGMGTTVVVLFVAGAQALIAHVGDSRAYLHAGGVLRQLTRDHSRVQKMVDAGLLAAADAASHPDASILERAIGVLPDVKVDISGWISLHEGDRILLCSDGLHGYVADSEIIAVLECKASPQELADRLVDLALRKGGEDNITVQLLAYGRSRDSAWSKMMRRLASRKNRRTTRASGIQTSMPLPLPAPCSRQLPITSGTAANGF
jgi:protein phosphatase